MILRPRTPLRTLQFAIALAVTFFDYLLHPPRTPLDRARWMQRGSQRALRILRVDITALGNFPSDGVLVSNHQSYLDILVFSALAPCVFVSKSDVRHWPIFGTFATLAGTIFVERERRQTAVIANRAIEEKMSDGLPIIFFPEGTTTDGSQLLPFKSSIFSPACTANAPIYCAHVQYELKPGNPPRATVAQNVCYWGEMSILPHMLGMLSLAGVNATIRFAAEPIFESDRKLAAHRAEETVRALASATASANPQSASA